MNIPILTKPYALRNAWLIWALVFVIIAFIVARPTNKRTVTPVYRSASINWMNGVSLYESGIGGYLYLPQAAVLYIPFAKLPPRIGEVAWRAFCLVLLAVAVWRLARLGGRGGGPELFPLMTLLVLPTALDSARNGQMNIPIAALMTFASIDLVNRRWSPATLWLVLGLALKPLILVLLAFSGILYRPMRWRLAAGLLIAFALPFLTQAPDFVLKQYELFFTKSQSSGNPGTLAQFSDLFGILSSLGIYAPFAVQTAVRILATVAIFWLCRLGLNRWGHVRGTILLFGITSCHTLLFNPRTENNTYVMAGVPIALFASWAILRDNWRLAGGMLILLIVAISGTYEITRGNNHWLCPAMTLVFLAYLIFLLIIDKKPAAGLD